MEAMINGFVSWWIAHREVAELVGIAITLVFGKIVTAIDRVHKTAIDNISTVNALTDDQKLDMACEDVLSLFGAKFGWLRRIPGVDAAIKWIIGNIYNALKPKK